MLGSGDEGKVGWWLSGRETEVTVVLPRGLLQRWSEGLGAGRRCHRSPPHLVMRSSFSSLSISSSMAACRSPMRLNASFRSACRLWLAASRLSRSSS